MKVIVDGFGGDNAPLAVLEAAGWLPMNTTWRLS